MSKNDPKVLNTSELLQMLPASLRMRLESVARYASALIDEPIPNFGKPALSRSDIEQIRQATIIYALREFLQRGAHAAKTSVSTFEALGFRGFAVGKTAFTKHSEATIRGDKLVRALDDTLKGTLIGTKLKTTKNIREFVQSLAKELHHA